MVRGTPITIALRRDGDNAIISVHNEGIEIEGTEQVKVFDSYFWAESAQKEEVKGWGLGLTVVKEMAEGHGGIVTVESSKEHGTTFTFTAPIRAAPSADDERTAA